MAATIWVITNRIWCAANQQEVDQLEERIYPVGRLDGIGQPYQVRSRKCTLGIECNLAGGVCRWSALNPNLDPFAEK